MSVTFIQNFKTLLLFEVKLVFCLFSIITIILIKIQETLSDTMEVPTMKLMKRPTKLEEMSKEQISQAILKKRECNVKAQKIVESLLEKNITEEYFLQCLPDLNQSHFEDIIEERFIIKLCGYPMCSNAVSDNDIPKQKYRISIKTNKVYDISARKSFCSNSCYKAALFIKKQMLTSPLWCREYEKIPVFNLLPMDSTGSIGQEIDLALIEKLTITDEKQVFTSVSDFAQDTIRTITNKENISEVTEKPTQTNQESKVEERKFKSIGTESEKFENKPCSSTANSLPTGIKKPLTNPLNIVGDIIERPEEKIDPILTEKPDSTKKINDESFTEKEGNLGKKLQKKQPSITAITAEVEKHLAEWFTLDTLIFLMGEEKVKEMVADKGESIKDYLNNYSKGIFYTSNTYDQYQALCRKLNMLELEVRKYDAQTTQRETKPLPDYSILQEESKKIQIKVKAFLAGVTETEETPNPTVDFSTTNVDGDNNLTQIPLMDKNAQNALRRKIVCQQLNKVFPDLLRSLGLLSLSINSDVRLLVNTFKLKANNITFRPIQWTLVAIIFIKLLSLRDKHLEYLLRQNTAYQHMQLLLLSYKQQGGYLDRLISWLTDVDRLIN